MFALPADRSPYPMRPSLSALIHDVARLRRKLLDEALRPTGLTRAQRWMLIQLSQFGEEGVSQTELARAMQAGVVSLGEKLSLLEAQGYVIRVRSATDRRQNKVRLTDEGYNALHHSTALTQAFNRQAMRGATDHELAVAQAVLAEIRANLLAMDQDATK
ncbi:MarR family transcriptional regulator (plasmid) [Sphingobium sp. SJ10-10]|uniref:MarR family winged helix-turn-helix transcriptional regulator n=1 Tax=Sphingobium sp. SJ10-10 TaxID=3114999 RepID=UPI002E184F45|nr:MarR family transcriptional regulator [Sphingobium sp. SJ10-10]